MRFCIKNNFFKKNLKFSLIFTISVFLSACESIPSNSSKPVFKIANFPSVKQKKKISIIVIKRLINQKQKKKQTWLTQMP